MANVIRKLAVGGGMVVTLVSDSAGSRAAAKLRKVRGVIDVSSDVPVSVGPPNSSDTW